MGNSNKENWKYFEKLAYEYVTYLYKNNLIKEQQQTQDSHDSGYDGLWIIMSKNQSYYEKILMEAKYRKSQSSLPLHDCAKAIIIAFNLDANKLYIATNIKFAPQTKEQIQHFNKRSNLIVTCINNKNLKLFIQTQKQYLINSCQIDKTFLEEIENSTDIFEELTEDNYRDIELEHYQQDEQRKNIISRILLGLQNLRGCYTLAGNEGVGKSILCKIIENKLTQKNFDVCKINLSLCLSSRILYLKILEAIWGITLTPILKDEKIQSYIDCLISVGENVIDKNISNAVKHILAANYYEDKEYEDNYLYLLLKYIDIILRNKQKNLRLVIYFENLNMASEEVLNFLLQLIKYLKKNGLGILLEIRTPFLLENQMEIEVSNFYFRQFKNCSDDYFDLGVLEHNTAVSFIQRMLGINSSYASEYLAVILGDNPLNIQSALKILNKEELQNKNFEDMSKEELEEYWDSYNISFNSVVLSLIHKLKSFSIFSSLFTITALLNGEIAFEILETIYKEKTENLIEEAIRSTIFKRERQKLVCSHLRFLSAMKKISKPYETVKMAKELLPIIQNNKHTVAHYPYIELDLLYILDKKEEIPFCLFNIISLLKDVKQYKKAIEIIMKYSEFQQNVPSFLWEENTLFVDILLEALFCIKELHQDNEEQYTYLYDLAKKYILRENPNYLINKNWYKYHLLLWNKRFIAGEFLEAQSISQFLLNTLKLAQKLFKKEDDYIGQVYNAHGLSVKMTLGGVEAEKFFKEGTIKYPSSFYIKAALLSQEGNRLLKVNPNMALEKYMELLSTVKGKKYPFQETLHTRIDIAMSSFLVGNYDVAIALCEESVDIASSVGIYMQKGRALNILGCCQAAKGQYNDSIHTFEESYNLLLNSKAMLYLWRPQINLASVLLKIGEEKEALSLLCQALEILKDSFMLKIKNDKTSVPYQSLLLILLYLYKANEKDNVKKILEEIGEKTIEENFFQILKIKNLKEVFHEKVIYNNTIILVTG